MPGTREGNLRRTAAMLGITFDELQARLARGEKRCRTCQQWKLGTEYQGDKSRGDGLKTECRTCVKLRNPARHVTMRRPRSLPPRVDWTGRRHTAEARVRMSISQRQRDPSTRHHRQPGFIVSQETRDKLSAAALGRPGWNRGLPSSFKGRTHGIKARQKMSAAHQGKQYRLGKRLTPAQRDYISRRTRQQAARGPQHPHWKGGITPVNHAIRSSSEYADWRKAVFERDSYTCQLCGDDKGGNLNAHHVLPFAQHPDKRLDVRNGITLCKTCHTRLHRRTGEPTDDQE